MANSAAVVQIPRSRLEEAVGVLAAAFEPDPLMNYIFAGQGPAYADSLRQLMRFACLVRFDLDWPLLGVEDSGRLVGVLGVGLAADTPWPDSLKQTYQEFGDVAGAEAVARLEAYSQLADSGRPEQPHIHVAMIGVDPNSQGRGVGRALLAAVQAMSRQDASSLGVSLDTENEASKRFYEACGYHCTGEHDLGGVTIWDMYQPDSV